MSIEFDEKGKYYTDIVTKQPVAVVIQTSTHLVRGFVHVRHGERLKNELERDEGFQCHFWRSNDLRSFGSCLLMIN